ncbi:hypothetical protein RO3G_04651 [Rhizopus delemar RA 99-880]|uniref:Uncharacterized protein n=1 Tax=Rhizopus delemar (strain RA 99-880 / ATCC MYA-4621 / FGSC 9543 / NRRL 43880) TaxID=246409 RepID=I1BUR6_RHIO9|nr:hypothetical protein RO3G_04651 [Rhizopus delemar RA 99-880]|eukprot:EIE79946.1 hypothetical protein RO3G_04651 [Rhizopus delemar RA 99-880]
MKVSIFHGYNSLDSDNLRDPYDKNLDHEAKLEIAFDVFTERFIWSIHHIRFHIR